MQATPSSGDGQGSVTEVSSDVLGEAHGANEVRLFNWAVKLQESKVVVQVRLIEVWVDEIFNRLPMLFRGLIVVLGVIVTAQDDLNM